MRPSKTALIYSRARLARSTNQRNACNPAIKRFIQNTCKALPRTHHTQAPVNSSPKKLNHPDRISMTCALQSRICPICSYIRARQIQPGNPQHCRASSLLFLFHSSLQLNCQAAAYDQQSADPPWCAPPLTQENPGHASAQSRLHGVHNSGVN